MVHVRSLEHDGVGRASTWKRVLADNRLALLSRLRDEFGIARLDPLDYRCWNAVFQGITPHQLLFVKVLRPGVDGRLNAAAELGAHVARNLATADVKEIIAPLPSRDGRLLLSVGSYRLLVYPWVHVIASSHGNQRPSTYFRAMALKRSGYFLARLHIVLGALRDRWFRLNCLERANVSPFAYGPDRWLGLADALWKAVYAKVDHHEEARNAVDSARRMTDALVERMPAFFSVAEGGQYLHGDFAPDNLLTTPAGLRLADFDMCHRGNVLEDVACGALAFSGPRWLMGERDLAAVQFFCGAYEEARRTYCSDSPIPVEMLSAALKWCSLRWLSLSFRADQVLGRFAALRSLEGYRWPV